MAEEKKAHPLFVAAIVGIPAIAVCVMLFFKMNPGEGSDAGSGSEPVKIIVKSEALKNWEKAVQDLAKVSPMMQKAAIAMGDLEDKLLEKEDIADGKKKLIGDLEALATQVKSMDDAATAVIEHYKKKWKLETEAEVLQKLSKSQVKEGNFGKLLGDIRRFKGDVKVKLKAAKNLGDDSDHSSTGGTK